MVTKNMTFSFYFTTWSLALLHLTSHGYCNPQLELDLCFTNAAERRWDVEDPGAKDFGHMCVSKKPAEREPPHLADTGSPRVHYLLMGLVQLSPAPGIVGAPEVGAPVLASLYPARNVRVTI